MNEMLLKWATGLILELVPQIVHELLGESADERKARQAAAAQLVDAHAAELAALRVELDELKASRG